VILLRSDKAHKDHRASVAIVPCNMADREKRKNEKERGKPPVTVGTWDENSSSIRRLKSPNKPRPMSVDVTPPALKRPSSFQTSNSLPYGVVSPTKQPTRPMSMSFDGSKQPVRPMSFDGSKQPPGPGRPSSPLKTQISRDSPRQFVVDQSRRGYRSIDEGDPLPVEKLEVPNAEGNVPRRLSVKDAVNTIKDNPRGKQIIMPFKRSRPCV